MFHFFFLNVSNEILEGGRIKNGVAAIDCRDNWLEFLELMIAIQFFKIQQLCSRINKEKFILRKVVVKLENIQPNKRKWKTAREKEQLPSKEWQLTSQELMETWRLENHAVNMLKKKKIWNDNIHHSKGAKRGDRKKQRSGVKHKKE